MSQQQRDEAAEVEALLQTPDEAIKDLDVDEADSELVTGGDAIKYGIKGE